MTDILWRWPMWPRQTGLSAVVTEAGGNVVEWVRKTAKALGDECTHRLLRALGILVYIV